MNLPHYQCKLHVRMTHWCEWIFYLKPLPYIRHQKILSRRRLTNHYTYEPRHEKTNVFLYMRKQRRGHREADQRLCFRYIDSTIPLLSKSEISGLWPSSVALQPGLCQTGLETRMLVFSQRGSYNTTSIIIIYMKFQNLCRSSSWEIFDIKCICISY